MLRINFPNVAHATQEISLGGIKYTFIYKFNNIDNRWRIDILRGTKVLFQGLKVLENDVLIKGGINLSDFDHGNIFCFRIGSDLTPIGRDNIGIGKNYELIYISKEEINAQI